MTGPARLPSGTPRLLLAAVVVAALALSLLWWRHARSVPAVPRISVAIEAGGGGAHETVLNASGYVTARRQATVSSKVTGQITEVLFEEGQKVPQGQVLARVDPSNLETSLRLAQAQLDVAQTALGETQTQWREASNECFRVLSLASNNVASPSEADKARAETDALAARLESRSGSRASVARRRIATWQQQLDDTVLRAPFAGVIVSKTAQPGEIISPLSAGGGFTRTGICTLVDMTSIEVEVDVNENYINRVFPAQPVKAVLDAYPDWRIPAHVIAIIPTADRQKGTVKVRVGFEQLDPRMLPDMGVKVSFEAAGPRKPLPPPWSFLRRPSAGKRRRRGLDSPPGPRTAPTRPSQRNQPGPNARHHQRRRRRKSDCGRPARPARRGSGPGNPAMSNDAVLPGLHPRRGEGLPPRLRGHSRLARLGFGCPPGRIPRVDGSLGIGQEHAAQSHRRPGSPRPGQGHRLRRRFGRALQPATGGLAGAACRLRLSTL